MGNRSVVLFILGFIFLFYLVYNLFDPPKILLGSTASTKALVIGVDYGHYPYHGYIQNVYYCYEVDSQRYVDEKTIGKSFGLQAVGYQVDIEYQINKPQQNNVNAFYQHYMTSNITHYYGKKDEGYSEISFNNGIFEYKYYAEYGKLLITSVGSIEVNKDSVSLNPFIKNGEIGYHKLEKFIESSDSKGNTTLMQIDSGRIFIEDH